jgi:uncharacterized membrane protein
LRPVTAVAAATFVTAGALHFTHTRVYERIMPPWLPAHTELVYASGVAEITGGLGLLHPRTRTAASWFLVVTLLAVFPANVHMALNPEDFDGVPGGHAALIARLPLQLAFIALVRAADRD